MAKNKEIDYRKEQLIRFATPQIQDVLNDLLKLRCKHNNVDFNKWTVADYFDKVTEEFEELEKSTMYMQYKTNQDITIDNDSVHEIIDLIIVNLNLLSKLGVDFRKEAIQISNSNIEREL